MIERLIETYGVLHLGVLGVLGVICSVAMVQVLWDVVRGRDPLRGREWW